MSDEPSSAAEFRGVVRLFPLPNLVLFPHVVQPLHIFEPRYRQLTADALADDRLITMALLKPGWEGEYDKRPAVYPVVCVGKVLKDERLADGRYNLLLHGLARARLVGEVPSPKLYRVGRAELLRDEAPASPGAERQLRERLAAELERWYSGHGAARQQVRQLLAGSLPLGPLCDIFSFALPLEPGAKQELLAELSVARRAERLLNHLGAHVPPPPAGQHFPPDFSRN